MRGGTRTAADVVLMDERGPQPFRARAGALLAGATTADFAVLRIRLAALDLSEAEIGDVRRCRVLLGRLDAGTLLDASEGVPPEAAARLKVLDSFIRSGRLEVRAAGLGWWAPDFSIFRNMAGEAALFGAHYFGAPYSAVGPSFTAELTDRDAVRLLRSRFDHLWEGGHDVLPAIRQVVENAHALALEARGRGRRPDRPTAAE